MTAMSVAASPAPSRFATALPPILMSVFALVIMTGVAVLAWKVNEAIGKYHDAIALKGLNGKPKPVEIGIGEADLVIPANLIRFPTDRRGGYVTAVDLLLLWPELEGYSEARSKDFRDASPQAPLVYVTITEAETPLDSTARLSTIYARDFTGPPIPGPGHLVGRRMAPESPYRGEIIYYQPRSETPFVVRCLAEETPEIPATCIREVSIGHGLTMIYRFNRAWLGEWHAMEGALVKLSATFFREG
jgi:hypothetical protein